jgi:transposase-like protein
MPKRYAREFRRAVCERLVSGEKVGSMSKGVGVSEATLYLWKRQALIDAGRAEGVKSFEADELAQAHRTIAELEAVKAAVALFNGEEPGRPKGGCQVAQGLSVNSPSTFAGKPGPLPAAACPSATSGRLGAE